MARDSEGLTPKDAMFVAEFMLDLNAARAARDAGFSESVALIASTWVSDPKAKPAVYKAIRRRMDARASRLRLEADWVLQRLMDEANADVADLIDEKGALKPARDWPREWRLGLVSGIDIQEEISPDGEKTGALVKVKLSDRVRRLELIGKHVDVGAFRDRVEHVGKDGGPIQVEASPRDIIEDRLAKLAKKRGGHETELGDQA